MESGKRRSQLLAVGCWLSAALLCCRFGGRVAGHMPQQLAHGPFERPSMNDGVDHAVIEEKFRRLESVGKVLTEILLDDAGASKSDHGARLGENRLAKHRVAGAHAAHRGIG